ncbi:MAG: 3-demethylubiquinone-9 3-O-methyltransferase, partial [Gammaproteobacteria bacterium]
LEHVPDPAAVVAACAQLARPGGHVFFATLNRTPKAYALAVLTAEYLLGMLPRGTHDYERFVRPSELDAWARPHDLNLLELRGVSYQPLARRYALSGDVSVNYLACYQAAAEAPGDST